MREFVPLSPEERRQRMEEIEQRIRQHIQNLTGDQNMRGYELIETIRRLSNLCDVVINESLEGESVSGPRFAILMRLSVDSELHSHGLTPTMLSHMQRVSKNTISSHIAGLEEQGLIRRESDPHDRRIYRLFITDAGREFVKKNAPSRIGRVTSMFKDFSNEELEQTSQTLKKVQLAMFSQIECMEHMIDEKE